jgi:hypothetical protein
MNEDGPNGSPYETLAKHDQSETKRDRQARYHVDNVQTLDIFTQGLPNALYADTYKLDDPQDYNEWKRRLLKRQ